MCALKVPIAKMYGNHLLDELQHESMVAPTTPCLRKHGSMNIYDSGMVGSNSSASGFELRVHVTNDLPQQ